ncbi:MAG: DUF2336 domain-containing protein [Caulobacteraceae bacterium]
MGRLDRIVPVQNSAPLDLAMPAEPAPKPSRARSALFKRLADVVCLPGSRVNAFERSMTADLLVEMLREAEPDERTRAAKRISSLSEIPANLVRVLLRDHIAIARPLLEDCASLSDTDLLDCARHAGVEHRRLIAARRGVGEVVAEELVRRLEPEVIDVLLHNPLAKLPAEVVDTMVGASQSHPKFIPLLLRRAELRPHQAYALFWWAGPEARRIILQRFAVSRDILQDAAGDVFAMAAAEGWQDPLARKGLQFIERRQRNRAAIEKSPFDSLEAAVAAGAAGMTREVAEEIAYLSGVKPMTGAKIFTDRGGEPLAILCKATGLQRDSLRALWRGLRRPETDAAGTPSPDLERVLIIYDMLAVDRAQTVLRYWNWSLSSAMTPALIRAIRDGDQAGLTPFSTPERTAMLAFAGEIAAKRPSQV